MAIDYVGAILAEAEAWREGETNVACEESCCEYAVARLGGVDCPFCATSTYFVASGECWKMCEFAVELSYVVFPAAY